MIKFSVSRLEKEQVECCGEEPGSVFELDENNSIYSNISPLRYNLKAQLVSGNVLITGSAGTVISGSCCRCLEPAKHPVSCDDIELLVEVEPGTEEIDVTDDIRGEVLLCMPYRLLCDDNCRGLCQHCGANLNKTTCQCRENASGNIPLSELNKIKL